MPNLLRPGAVLLLVAVLGGCESPTTEQIADSTSEGRALAADEIFYLSPLPEDHRPREEVITTYLQYAADPSNAGAEWAAITMAGVTFYAPPDAQWNLLLELIERAPDDDRVLQDIAAGPLEGFLGRFGDSVIADVEVRASTDPKFARTLSGVWQHGMSDATWQRVRAIQARVKRPLPEMRLFE